MPIRIPSRQGIDLCYPDIVITVRFNGLFIGPTRTYKEQKEAETAVEEKEANKKAEDKGGKGRDRDKDKRGMGRDKRGMGKRDLNIAPQVLPIPASQTPLIRKIPMQAHRDNPNDMDNRANDQGTHAAIVLELGQLLLTKLKPE